MMRGAWLALVVLCGSWLQAADQAPGLLLVTLDTTRADVLAPATATPVLDRLAARGVRWTGSAATWPFNGSRRCARR